MYLKSLEMQGFKSFPDKTKLIFENEQEVKFGSDSHGVTVIVGPNGSGKSNIADAMRWVLGEISSKSLRGSKMEDVIFGGADSRRPMGYAEVSVTFDNRGEFSKLDCPYDEVTVTRRYYRAGESEYFINRKGVRLKDIYELFMNTGIGRDGYSIIGQGRIAEMVSRKSEERRSVFEDASGIARYRYKKNEAERKLQDTEENMARVNDIFAEVSAQVGPLEKEAEKAKKAIELMEDKKRADVSIWLYDTERLHDDLASAEEEMRHAGFDLAQAEDTISALTAQNDKLFEASQGSKQESEQLLEQIREKTEYVHNLDSEFRVAETTVSHAHELIESTDISLQTTLKNLSDEESSAKAHEEKIALLEGQSEELKGQQDALTQEQENNDKLDSDLETAVATAGEDLKELESQAIDVTVRLSVLENTKNTDSDKNSSALTELESYRKISAELEDQCGAKERTIAKYDEELASIAKEITDATDLRAATDEKLQVAIGQMNNEILRRDSIIQRINTIRTMEEHFEGYSGAVRFVMEQYENGNIPGRIYGPLSKVISVDGKYVTAIETALGANLQHIVVEDEETAKASMFALKKAEAGRATFFPLTSMRPQEPTREMGDAKGYAGYIGVADTLVKAEQKFSNVLSSLLGRTLIFDTIDHATVMAKSLHYKVRAVTLDGQQINVGGSFTGGSVRTGSGVLSRAADVKRLEDELAEKEESVKLAEKQVEDLREAVEDAVAAISSAEDRRDLIGVLKNTEQGQLEQLHGKLEANNTLYEKLHTDMAAIEEAQARYVLDIDSLKEEEKNLRKRISELTDFRNEKEAARADVMVRREELSREMTNLIIRISEVQKDIETENTLLESARGRVDALNRERITLEGRINTQKMQIETTEEKMSENRKNLDEGNKALEKLTAKRNDLEKGNSEFERKLNDLNSKLRDKMNQKELIFREYTKCENKYNSLRENQDKLSSALWDEYEMTRADAVALGYPPLTKENRQEMVELQSECRRKIKAIGSVDLDAVNKYADVKARYDYMNGQISDLEKARKDLTGIIDQLESEMKETFVDSFNKINENFGRVFSELFGGGSAELSLSDPENVLESGIEIKAAPPGKIIKSLMQLSGGEQAFIGVALFFAILQVNPTPFCILDEIEAALDEVNVERLAQYIKRYSHGTQFIMITHRRGTMAAADRLYGVTMPEHGISKVLMLDINDISKQEGAEWNGIFG